MNKTADTQRVTGTDVFHWFSEGAKEVYAHVRHLNIINVFPVADGDTGTNLAATLRAMVNTPPTQHFHHMLQTISQSALEGARGNSGILFASYVNGLALESTPYEAVSVAQFAGIAQNAVKHLYSAVEDPKEGTLVSVIRDWAAYLKANHGSYRKFDELFAAAYAYALQLLKKTKEQLDVLRRYNVVDAGAAGFVRFLEGVNRVFSGSYSEETFADEPFVPLALDGETSPYRYCTEALVRLPGVQEDYDALISAVKARLQAMGDSLIVNAQGGKLKAHIHTNAPELVMEALAAYGEPEEQKADDMSLQTKLRVTQKGGVGLITDSIADLPDAFVLEHSVSVLPLGVLKGGTAYLDKLTIRLPQLFQAMDAPDAYPTTSQPEPARVRALLAARLEQFDSLIVLSVADKLSGTYQAVQKAAKELETPEKKITVIDTRLNSGAQGLLVLRAAELVRQGLSHDEIVASVRERIPRTKIYVCLNTLKYAVRGGRVPNTVGKIGMAIGMRPIMTLDPRGHGAAFGVAFSQQGLTRKIMRLVRRAVRKTGLEAYGIVHGGNLPLAREYEERLTQITGLKPAFISEISSAVAIHSGPGTVAVCYTAKGGETA